MIVMGKILILTTYLNWAGPGRKGVELYGRTMYIKRNYSSIGQDVFFQKIHLNAGSYHYASWLSLLN